MSSDKVAKELYKKSKRYFYKNITFNTEAVNDSELLDEIENLNKKYRRLMNEYEILKNNVDKDIDTDRFYDTFKAISDNVKKGREELLSKKIYNTINTVNSSLTY